MFDLSGGLTGRSLDLVNMYVFGKGSPSTDVMHVNTVLCCIAKYCGLRANVPTNLELSQK